MDNYLDLTVNEVYEVIRAGNNWPKHFGKQEKVQMLESLTLYFASAEQFEKCIHLQKMLNEINNV